MTGPVGAAAFDPRFTVDASPSKEHILRVACPICRSDDTRSLLVHKGFDICRCRRCDHLWAAGCGPADYLNEPSLLERFKQEEPLHRALMRKNLGFLKKWLRPGARILDFGCGSGMFVLEARAAGYDAVGVDLAAWVADAAAHWRLPLHVGSLETAGFAEGSFDAIVSIVCFEHLDDPVGITGSLVRLLKPGGILAVLSIPHSRGLPWLVTKEKWWDLEPPNHLHFFSRSSLATLFKSHGLKVLGSRTTGVGTGFFSSLLGRDRDERTSLDLFQQQTNAGAHANGDGSPVKWFASRVAIPVVNAVLNATNLGNNLTMVGQKT